MQILSLSMCVCFFFVRVRPPIHKTNASMQTNELYIGYMVLGGKKYMCHSQQEINLHRLELDSFRLRVGYWHYSLACSQ